MSNKYFGGVVTSTGVTGEVDADLKAVVTATRDRIAGRWQKLRVADAISEVFALFRRCNKYIDETTPWVLAKDEAQKDRLAEVLYNLTESITIGASLCTRSFRKLQKKSWRSYRRHCVILMNWISLVCIRMEQK